MTAPRLTADQREKIVALWFTHLGELEEPPGSNNTPYGRWYGINPAAWCAMSLSWHYYQVVGHSPFPASTSKGFAACQSGVNWFKNQGAWADGNQTPQRGWVIFFDWEGDGHADHTGMVLDAGAPRDVNTVEGNSSDMVALHHRGGSTIMGYGIINYVTDAPPVGPRPQPAPTFPGVGPGVHNHDVTVVVQTLLHQFAVKYKQPACDPGPIDGQFGPLPDGGRTGRAVMAFKRNQHDFQTAFHKPVSFTTPYDPNVGPITYNALLFWDNA